MLLGEGLQFASVVALTVSFGLGLSATIHFLNRLRLESKPGRQFGLAVERATVLVGPALILTTVVLACGLVVTVFSDLPSLRLFGWLSAFCDGRGAGRGSLHPAADGDVPDQPVATDSRDARHSAKHNAKAPILISIGTGARKAARKQIRSRPTMPMACGVSSSPS